MDEDKIGQKVIKGKNVNFDDDDLEELAQISEELKEDAKGLKSKIDKKID